MLGHRKLTSDDYIGILKRRKLLIILPVVLFPIIAYAITFFITAIYVSQSLVLVEEKKIPDEMVKSIIQTGLGTRLAAMEESTLSRTRLEPIVTRYNLYPTKRLSMDDRIDLTRKAISIAPVRSEINRMGGLPGFTVSYQSGDPRTAQQVCAEITSLFISENLHNRETAAVGTTDFLKKQLEDAKANLDSQDAKLAAFQREHLMNMPMPGQEAMTGNVLSSLSSQLDAANQAVARTEQDKEVLESLLAQQLQMAAAQNAAASSGVPTNLGGGPTPDQIELQGLQNREAVLRTQYTDSYPDVVAIRRQIADLRRKIAQTPTVSAGGSSSPTSSAPRFESQSIVQLRAQIRQADYNIKEKQKQQVTIQRSMGEYQNRLQASPLLEEQFKALTRDYSTARSFYDEMQNKINHSKLATDLERGQQGEQFTVMDGANLPDEPTFPKRWLFALGGIMLGLAVGGILSAFLEYKDTALRNEQDVWAFTQLPTLAVIAYSGALVFQQKKPGLMTRLTGLFRRSPSAGNPHPDDFTKANG